MAIACLRVLTFPPLPPLPRLRVVDIGGTNIRAGVVNLNLKKNPNLGKAKVWKFSLVASRR